MNHFSRKSVIYGGPTCIGDSGGPLYKLGRAGKKMGSANVPVLTGVFSFVLWGTCHGTEEAAYYGRLAVPRKIRNRFVGQDDFALSRTTGLLKWITKYVPKKELCLARGDKKKNKMNRSSKKKTGSSPWLKFDDFLKVPFKLKYINFKLVDDKYT